MDNINDFVIEKVLGGVIYKNNLYLNCIMQDDDKKHCFIKISNVNILECIDGGQFKVDLHEINDKVLLVAHSMNIEEWEKPLLINTFEEWEEKINEINSYLKKN